MELYNGKGVPGKITRAVRNENVQSTRESWLAVHSRRNDFPIRYMPRGASDLESASRSSLESITENIWKKTKKSSQTKVNEVRSLKFSKMRSTIMKNKTADANRDFSLFVKKNISWKVCERKLNRWSWCNNFARSSLLRREKYKISSGSSFF